MKIFLRDTIYSKFLDFNILTKKNLNSEFSDLKRMTVLINHQPISFLYFDLVLENKAS